MNQIESKPNIEEEIPQGILDILDLPNCALIVSDMQELYLMNYFGDLPKLVNQHLKLIDYCNLNNIPVFFVGRDLKSGGLRKMNQKISEKIIDNENQVIDKQTDDAFFETNLEAKLKSNSVKTILLLGLNVDGCIYKTAISAKKHNLQVYTTNYASLINSKETFEWTKNEFKKKGISYQDI